MKKLIIFAATAAAVLSACSKNEVIQKETEATPVSFGVYVPKAATKAGATGTITVDGTAGTTTSLQTTGFGVFATYSDGADYAATTGPNFMWNTQVSTASWTYSPVKYWPNETIDDGTNAATAPANADKLSFFAYAPYVAPAAATGVFTPAETTGITALSANNATTDPTVTYVVDSDPSNSVDLLWAVAGSAFSYTDVHGATVNVAAGMPFKNLTKPNTTLKVPFHFRHATARLGFKIVGAFDQVAAGGTLESGTKVTVADVRIVNLPVATTGTLNLNNTAANTPLWTATPSTINLIVTGDDLNADIKDSGVAEVQTVDGVTASAVNVFNEDNKYFTLIPIGTSTTARVQITYYVTTADANLNGGFSRVQNVIYKDLTFASGFEAGKAYTIKIILGLTSVKLEATVEAWDVQSDVDVNLPINIAGA